jgi:hypothetical protein
MGAAGVVADHSAQRAAVVRGWIGRQRKPVRGGRVAQLIADDAGLHAGKPVLGIEFDDAVEVLGEVDEHTSVDALPGQPGAAAAGGDRQLILTAQLDGGDDIVGIAGKHDPGRNLTIDGGIVGVQRAITRRETHFACDCTAQLAGQLCVPPGRRAILSCHPIRHQRIPSAGATAVHTRHSSAQPSPRAVVTNNLATLPAVRREVRSCDPRVTR